MKLLKQLFHFLGGIHVALALIGVAALTVVAGTILESKTGSHLLAARWTYEHPFFQLLLSLFFINILFSALRRWPFKTKHIPFLITHLGLLMIIGGTILKNRYGLQGSMSVWEGSGNSQVLLPHTYAIYLDKKGSSPNQQKNNLIPLESFQQNIFFPHHFPDVKCKLIGYAPHVIEKPSAWIKDSKAYLSGFPPLPVLHWDPSQPLPASSRHLRARGSVLEPWSVKILRTSDAKEAVHQSYLEDLFLLIKAKDHRFDPLEIELQKALQEPFSYAEGLFSAQLHFPFPIDPQAIPSLELSWKEFDGEGQEKFVIPLKGNGALQNQCNPLHVLAPRFTADLFRTQSSLCLAEDQEESIHLMAFDPYGRIHGETFIPSKMKSVVSYDQGFGGYSIQAVVPIPSFPSSREDKEKADAHELAAQLKLALASNPSLAPPLQVFDQGCKKAQADFARAFIQFLSEWNNSSSLLFRFNYQMSLLTPPLDQILANLDWNLVSVKDRQAALWTRHLFEQLEEGMRKEKNLIILLQQHRWPFISELEERMNEKGDLPLNILAEQISKLIPHLPVLEFPDTLSTADQASLLSAYLRVYGIDYSSLMPVKGGNQEDFSILETYWKEQSSDLELKTELAIVFETPLSNQIIPKTPPLKLEDRQPGIVLEFQQGQEKQTLALAYDPNANGMKWPILNGNFAVRFQPFYKEIPYRIRLRQARQISYPQSSQIYSYESDLLIAENGGTPIHQTLSMNHVHETWDGYRFYLSGVGTSLDNSLKRIQLAVNHDPAKYYLTYPGALFVFLGIILLFWVLPYYKNSNK